jgi:hypothetical protein
VFEQQAAPRRAPLDATTFPDCGRQPTGPRLAQELGVDSALVIDR